MRSFASLALLLCLAGLILAAPAPKAKPLPPPLSAADIQGDWEMQWQASWHPCGFAKDGFYWCMFAGHPWQGTWSFKDGVLTVEEGTQGNPASLKWSVKLDANKSGTVEGVHAGTPFALRVRKGPKI